VIVQRVVAPQTSNPSIFPIHYHFAHGLDKNYSIEFNEIIGISPCGESAL